MSHPTMSAICSIDEAVGYRDPDIVDRFGALFTVSQSEAEAIFDETKKWIWLLAVAATERKSGRDVPRLVIDSYLNIIDEMWHNFLLFTRRYDDYCQSRFGFFVHHDPTPPREKKLIMRSLETSNGHERILDARRQQYLYVAEKLGSATLELWYDDWSDLYTPTYVKKLRR